MTDVAVIGAGPYGLSVAAHLKASGIDFRIFGEPMGLWRNHMPHGLTLKSDGFASNLCAPDPFTLKEYCAETGENYADIGWRTPRQTLIEYGITFQWRRVGPVEQKRVVAVQKHGSGFSIRLDDDSSFFAQRVVVATGLLPYRTTPDFGLPIGIVSHSSELNDLRAFAGQRVAVIGGGQSATESAALLHEAGAKVTLVSRRPILWFDPDKETHIDNLYRRVRSPNFGLGPGWRTWFWSEQPAAFRWLPESVRQRKAYGTFGPAGSGWIKHRVVGQFPIYAGQISVHKGYHKAHFAVETDDGIKRFQADHIVAATGYQTNVHRIGFLSPLSSQIATIGGAPKLGRGFQASVDGLHFVGYHSAVSYGPSMRFIYGTWFAAREVERLISRGRSSTTQVYVQQQQPA